MLDEQNSAIATAIRTNFLPVINDQHFMDVIKEHSHLISFFQQL